MQRTRDRRLASLQAGRAIAAMLVVLQHVAYFVGGTQRYWNQPQVARVLAGTALGVEFFFVLSGVVMMLAHRKDFGKPKTIQQYWRKRFWRIYPIYWIVLALWLLERETAHKPIGSLLDLVQNVLLVQAGTAVVLLVVAWTLFHEVLFYGVFSTLLIRVRVGAWVLGVWLAGSLAMLFVQVPSALLAYVFSPLHLLFGCGMGVGVLLRRGLSKGRQMFWAGITLFGIDMVLAWRLGEADGRVVLLAGAASALTLLGAAELERCGRLTVPRWLDFMGNASYSIYLIHYPVLATIVRPVYRMSRWAGGWLPLWMGLLWGVAILAGCFLHIVVETPLLRWRSNPSRRHTERARAEVEAH